VKKNAAAQTRFSVQRDRIVAMATDALDEDGVSGFTLAGVGKRLGLHPASTISSAKSSTIRIRMYARF
jgi:AcrR family transcriptional regulator